MAAPSEASKDAAFEVFCAYAQKDEPLQQMLKAHLSDLQYQGRSLLLYDRLLLPGMDQVQEIDQHINSADIILLLVSADMLATRYSYGREMACAFERHAAGEVRLIPIILRAVNWQNQPFAKVQVLPSTAKPITSWSNQDEAITNVANGIRQVLRMRESGPVRPPQSTSTRGSYRVWHAPFALNPLFTEYDQLLIRIFAQLLLNQSVAISGPSGSSKSQIATAYIYRHCQHYQAILWVDANTPEALYTNYAKLATLLYGRQEQAREQEENIQAVRSWLEANKHWLLILDNLDDPSILFPVDEANQTPQSSPFLPTTLNGHLLITTRATNLNLGLARPGAMIDLTSE